MQLGQKRQFVMDLILCIDCSRSMNKQNGNNLSFMERTKRLALRIYPDICWQMKRMCQPIEQMRVKVILFGKTQESKGGPLVISDFFVLPQERQGFEAFVTNIRADGCENNSEDGINALYHAVNAGWAETYKNSLKRHAILYFSNTGDLSCSQVSHNSAQDRFKFLYDFMNCWQELDLPLKLFLFAPDVSGCKQLSDELNRVFHCTDAVETPLTEQAYKELIYLLANRLD